MWWFGWAVVLNLDFNIILISNYVRSFIFTLSGLLILTWGEAPCEYVVSLVSLVRRLRCGVKGSNLDLCIIGGSTGQIEIIIPPSMKLNLILSSFTSGCRPQAVTLK